jgi:hypothetical protein
MQSGPGDDLVNPKWASLALGALLNSPDVRNPTGELAIETDGEHVTVSIGPNGRAVTSAASGKRARAQLTGPFPEIVGLAAGANTIAQSTSIAVEGDPAFAEACLRHPRE